MHGHDCARARGRTADRTPGERPQKEPAPAGPWRRQDLDDGRTLATAGPWRRPAPGPGGRRATGLGAAVCGAPARGLRSALESDRTPGSPPGCFLLPWSSWLSPLPLAPRPLRSQEPRREAEADSGPVRPSTPAPGARPSDRAITARLVVVVSATVPGPSPRPRSARASPHRSRRRRARARGASGPRWSTALTSMLQPFSLLNVDSFLVRRGCWGDLLV